MEQENLGRQGAPTASISLDAPAFASISSSAARLTPKQLVIEIALRVCTVSALSVFLVSAILQVLKRSFGLLPANRGVVVSGPYRVLRHLMYLGYVIRNVGFLLPNFGLQNVIVFAVHFCVQICRIVREERLLSKDRSYREFMSRVRHRLIFGVF
ncbi:methyltransferase family protein [Paraburkholderia youngii]|uniref:methyltransferase family protein n=1 Tax=Paraburkholderia youngii TaxID=2782701 RepID=UPI003D1D21C3